MTKDLGESFVVVSAPKSNWEWVNHSSLSGPYHLRQWLTVLTLLPRSSTSPKLKRQMWRDETVLRFLSTQSQSFSFAKTDPNPKSLKASLRADGFLESPGCAQQGRLREKNEDFNQFKGYNFLNTFENFRNKFMSNYAFTMFGPVELFKLFVTM